ncbi:hypothetical protein JCM15765_14770 [Paradesulfitobacterium aromaticivorans]
MIKYVIIKQFRDPSGLRLPGEFIELTPSRATALKECGLLGGEYVPQEPEGDKPTSDGTDDAGRSEGTKREIANQEPKEGEVNEPEGDKPTGDRPFDPGGSEKPSKGGRNR